MYTFFLSKKIHIGLAIGFLSFLFFNLPQKAYAQWVVSDPVVEAESGVSDIEETITAITEPVNTVADVMTSTLETAQATKSFALDPMAWYIAKTIIKQLTAQTVRWINSGFQGNPAFVTNPNQFFLNTADNIVSHYLSSSSLNLLCSPFRAKVQLALVKSYLNDEHYTCTLGKIEQNFDQFTNDFTQGGWDGWFSMTQSTEGNPYGSLIEQQDQLAVRIGNNKLNYQNQLNWGKGFLSYQKCKDSASATSYSTGDGSTQSGCAEEDKETVTPGSVIENQLETQLGSGVKQLELANSINQVVSALMVQLVGQVVGGIGNGLRGLSQTSAANPVATIDQLSSSSPQSQAETNQFTQGVSTGITSILDVASSTTPNNPTEADIKTDLKTRYNIDINPVPPPTPPVQPTLTQ